jgi:hypothetical protein
MVVPTKQSRKGKSQRVVPTPSSATPQYALTHFVNNALCVIRGLLAHSTDDLNLCGTNRHWVHSRVWRGHRGHINCPPW